MFYKVSLAQEDQGKVKYRKIIPYNLSEYLTPLALAI